MKCCHGEKTRQRRKLIIRQKTKGGVAVLFAGKANYRVLPLSNFFSDLTFSDSRTGQHVSKSTDSGRCQAIMAASLVCVRALTKTHTHADILWHMAQAKSPKTLDIKTKYGTTTELQWRPLSRWRGCWQQFSLWLLCLPASVWSSLPLSLLCRSSLSSLTSDSSLHLKSKRLRWQDRKEAQQMIWPQFCIYYV